MKKFVSLLMCICMLLGIAAFSGCGASDEPAGGTSGSPQASKGTPAVSESEKEALREKLKAEFLSEADKVVITDDAVTFTDASSADGSSVTISKNPQKTVNLYASFTTLWYEAGGTVIGCIGGDTSVDLYQEYIGRDITADGGVSVVATSSSGKKWDVETIINLQPDLIICSTAMSGYSTIQAPAAAARYPRHRRKLQRFLRLSEMV